VKIPRRYPAPNYLLARYLGPIVIVKRDPENERKKKRKDRGSWISTGFKAAGVYPAAPKIIGDSRLRQ